MNRSKDISGKRFRHWTAIKELPELRKGKNQYWLCRCDCGFIHSVAKYFLSSGKTTNCQKCRYQFEDLTGKKFGKFLVLKYLPDHKFKERGQFWQCQCECGTILEIPKTVLLNGRRIRCRKCTYEDLTGQIFGKQHVIRRDHKTKTWLIKCDCGLEKWKKPLSIKQSFSCGRCESGILIGKKIAKLTILEYAGSNKKGGTLVKSRCECGNEKILPISNIIHGRQVSCGCQPRINCLESAENLIGSTFGYLTVKKIAGFEKGKRGILLEVRCKCGTRKIIERGRLGGIKSCGCLSLEARYRGELHHASKLSNADVKSIRELISLNIYKLNEISKMYKVSASIISKINKNKTFRSSSSKTPRPQLRSQSQEP